jgi:transcriptional regulator with XRE-family HTH domain
MPKIKKPVRTRSRHYIKQWREHRHVSQTELALRCRVAQSTYQRIEAGKVPYNQDFLELCAAALLCSVADLLTHSPNDKSSAWSIMSSLLHQDQETLARVSAVVQVLVKA